MAVLLTGGAGFIGSHVAAALLESGQDVVSADNYSNSQPQIIGLVEKAAAWTVKSGQTGHIGSIRAYDIDIKNSAALDEVFSDNNISAVIHLAGFKSVPESTADPLKYYVNNVGGSISLLSAMERHNCKTVVFSSSATVYNPSKVQPLTEDMPAGDTANPYGRTKFMIERMICDLCAADPAYSAVLLRYFNPIGAHGSGFIGEDPRGVPNNLMPYIAQVAAGRRPALGVFGADYPTRDGTGVRDYIHVTDLARGHVSALGYAEKNKGAEVFNLGAGVGVSVFEMIAAFERATGVKIPFEIKPKRDGDLPEYYADPTKARQLLGWEAERTIEDACADTWKHLQITDNR